ncbi:hypothetical protein FRC17_002043, partial [Serendipita sp. 399]
ILRGHWKTILVGTSLDFAPHPFEEPVIHSTSAFVGPEQHLRYISDILWPDTPLEEVVSTRGALLHRLFSWLRGRHSITSSFVEICEGYRNEDIGELLDAFIYNSIHHYARSHDIIDRPIHQKPFLPRWFMDIVLHDDEQYRGLLRVFFNIILHGTSPISLEKAYELVGCGLFRFTDSTPPEAILDEPFAICWLAQMLVRKSPGTLSALRDQVNLCFERGAEEYTPSADARADIRDYFLEDEESLETLFEALWNTLELRDEAEMLFPEWANEKLYEGMRTTLPRRRQRSSARSRKQKGKKKKGRRSYVPLQLLPLQMKRIAYHCLPGWFSGTVYITEDEYGGSLKRKLASSYKVLKEFQVWRVDVDAQGSPVATQISSSDTFCDLSYPLHLVICPTVPRSEIYKLVEVPSTPSLFVIAKELDSPLCDYVHAAAPIPIPQGSRCNFPHHDLRLHDLGTLESQDEMVAQRIAALYAGKELNILWNAPGTGKSRLAIEGLTCRWGIYLPCHGFANPASNDLQLIMHNLRIEKFSTSENNTKPPSPVSRMQAHIGRMLKRLFCSRLIVFAQFLVYASKAGGPQSHSHQLKWLLLQLLPLDIFSRDVFVAQFRDLCEQPDIIVNNLLSAA